MMSRRGICRQLLRFMYRKCKKAYHRYSYLASGSVIFFKVLALGERDFSMVMR